MTQLFVIQNLTQSQNKQNVPEGKRKDTTMVSVVDSLSVWPFQTFLFWSALGIFSRTAKTLACTIHVIPEYKAYTQL